MSGGLDWTGQVAATYRIGRAASPSRKQIRHVGGSGVGVGAREAGGGGWVAAAIVGIKVLDEWEIGTAGRKGWMDRVEWEASSRSARGRGWHHRKVKMFDLGCAWDCVPYAERRMAVGKSWLAVMMLLLRWLATCCVCG